MAITIKDMLITPNKWSRPQTKIGTIKNIVVHWIGNAGTTAENNAKYFNSQHILSGYSINERRYYRM